MSVALEKHRMAGADPNYDCIVCPIYFPKGTFADPESTEAARIFLPSGVTAPFIRLNRWEKFDFRTTAEQ